MMEYKSFDDEQLVILLKQGDHSAFTEIYKRFWHVLYLHSYKMLQDKDSAEDVIQDIFTSLWNNSASLNISVSIKSYLYTSVRNHTLNLLNREKIKGRYMDSLCSFIERDSSFTEEQVRYRELAAIIETEVANLPPKMQEIFKKSRNEGLAHREIAEELAISENTVKSTINRALKVIRSKFDVLLLLTMINFEELMRFIFEKG